MPTVAPATPPPRAQALVNGQNVGSVNADWALTDPNAQFTHLAGAFTPVGTMTANISTPSATQTSPAPAVVTSTNAQNDLANKQNQVNQLNTDTANHQVAVSSAAANTAPATNGADTSTTSPTASSTGNSDTSGSLDSQVNDILSSFNSSAKSIEDNANTEAGTLGDEAQQAQTDLDNAAATNLSKLNQIASGNYPLSPAEQSILGATMAQFQQTIQFQQQANASYTGQMTEAMASLGINTTAPTQAMGMISAAINVGTQRITDINSQMAVSLGNLQLSFQKQDFDQVQASWDETSKYMEDRINTLTTMQKDVQSAAAQQVTELQTQTQMNLTTMMDSAKFTYQQKQDAIQNAFSQQQINETQRHDLATEATARLTAEAAIGGLNGNTNNGLPNVGTTSTGAPDPVAQAQFLAQFSPQTAAVIKGIANYSLNPSSLPTSAKQAMGGLTQGQAVALASQYNPNYDEKSYGTRAAMQKSVTSGQYSQTITAANTLVQHLSKLQSDYAALGNTGALGGEGNFFGLQTPGLNSAKNTAMEAMGSGNVNAVRTDINAVASEAAKIYKGTGAASDQEISAWQKGLSPDATPGQMQAAIQGMADLMGGKLSTLSDNYSSVMGQPGNFQILTDQSAANLKKLGVDPSTVDPTYGNSPTLKLQTFNGASSDNAAMLKQINQIAPDATPDEVVQMLQAEGYQI